MAYFYRAVIARTSTVARTRSGGRRTNVDLGGCIGAHTAAAAGHRAVLVTATDGRMRDEDDDSRLDELRSSADILGVHRIECLGYADCGYGPGQGQGQRCPTQHTECASWAAPLGVSSP
jgi:LmbE family N-acetylglucosaminyl deacetylase